MGPHHRARFQTFSFESYRNRQRVGAGKRVLCAEALVRLATVVLQHAEITPDHESLPSRPRESYDLATPDLHSDGLARD